MNYSIARPMPVKACCLHKLLKLRCFRRVPAMQGQCRCRCMQMPPLSAARLNTGGTPTSTACTGGSSRRGTVQTRRRLMQQPLGQAAKHRAIMLGSTAAGAQAPEATALRWGGSRNTNSTATGRWCLLPPASTRAAGQPAPGPRLLQLLHLNQPAVVTPNSTRHSTRPSLHTSS